MAERVTNLVLLEKINNLKEYLVERNNLQDKKIELQEQEIKNNTIAIAGIKGASGVIAFVVSTITTLTGIYFSTKR